MHLSRRKGSFSSPDGVSMKHIPLRSNNLTTRLMFVRDSINRNQWESMLCFVQPVIPSGKRSLTLNGSLNVFRAEEYNATVEFYWAPFLVESNSDDPKMHSILNRIIMPESIAKHAENWRGVDVLIFNTYIWWMNTFKMKVLIVRNRGSICRWMLNCMDKQNYTGFEEVFVVRVDFAAKFDYCKVCFVKWLSE
ncbi:xylan O-acetyltransferase 1-like isoform X2 [Nymphaea colorata]|uniref:xylan O-acetyltransferase 1-like isoform X2 n=1 Tax=Nymphaea colorata TaxID=210225 RepID=UPI00214EA209|nr:xylan O-acetyltransferase 1-like isoform X2 [Nymphaea colorata]